MKIPIAIIILLLAGGLSAAEIQTKRDIAYTEPADDQRRLDVYWPPTGTDHPIAVWIHGGGWRKGDKASVQHKPQAFVDQGFVFVSINYRFVPQVTIEEMTKDVAKAILWTHRHADEFNASADSIHVLGHSAGAHLAALVSTDATYLQAEGLPLKVIKSCVPVDTAAYDVPAQIASIPIIRSATYKSAFGRTEAVQARRSPKTHVGPGKDIPPFLILHVADRVDSTAQSTAFAKALSDAGVEASVFAAEGKDHGSINRDLGMPNDAPTKAMFEFLTRITDTGFTATKCEGTYRHHLQGVCTNDRDSIYWSFTTMLVKTNKSGAVQHQVEVANHHGDLCHADNKIYVAVNLGRFNDPDGNADSWVYVYDADDLSLITKHETQEVVHGAGGIAALGGKFYVVGGLPEGVSVNFVYEYDSRFRFIQKHVLKSGHTHLGIQTAAFADERWWFGCYGTPKILLVADRDLNMLGRYEFDCSLGVVGITNGRLLTAGGQCRPDIGCAGHVQVAESNDEAGLKIIQ